ncbi:MAG TPA: penicillin-binding protein [Candidatus Cryosericum sp.]|nr:penicillin-binding protein [Candidatus Cryosericum sp.]
MSRLRARFQRLPGPAAGSGRGPGVGGARWRRLSAPAPAERMRRTRLAAIIVGIIAGLSGLAARCVHLQVFRAPALLELARAQHEGEITLDPLRGPILDRNGRELALSLAVDSVFADPSEVGDAGAAARRLAPILGMKPAALRERLASDGRFVWLKRKIDPDLRKRIEALEIPGIAFVRESRRFYPKRDLAAHAVGACGVDNQGLAGVEFAFNDRFTGTPGQLQFVRDGKGDRVLDRSRVEPIPGHGVILTLDEAIQHIAERELDAAMQETGANGSAIVVLRPQTGEILALASRPDFDPNLYPKAGESARHNRAVGDFYEPGSTFKVITAAAALDAGKVRPAEVIYCENGSYFVAKHRYHEDRLPFGNLTFTEVLAKSSNIGTIKVAQRLRSSDFHDALLRFGFGSESALELPGESPGLLRDLDDWSGLSQASIAMGQEIGVTPIQLAAAIGAVANDGVYAPPHLIEAFTDPDGSRVAPEEAGDGGERRAVSAQAARTLRRMLESVTSDGTGTAAKVPGYSTGGKTGTAQKIDPATRRYARGRHIAWFVGFVPADRPALVIVVMVDEPKGPKFHGGDVAAPVFSRVAQPVLQYLGVPADREPGVVLDAPLRASAPRRGGEAVAAVRRQSARQGAPTAKVEAAILGRLPAGDDASRTMPDLTGMTLRQATETLAAQGLNCSSQRRGPRVTEQQPGPGSPVRAGDRCALVYE